MLNGAAWQDFRYAVRALAHNPGFTGMAVLILALGIGSSTAIFSILDSVLLRPFPYTDVPRLVFLEIIDTGNQSLGTRGGFFSAEYLDYVEQNHAFDRVIGYGPEDILYRGSEGTEHLAGGLVTPGTFEFLGVPPLLGRALHNEDYRAQAVPVFVLRYKTWVSRFQSDPHILNRTFVLDGTPRTLVGIMPPRFAWGNGDLWIPDTPTRASQPGLVGLPRFYLLLGHLRPGITLQRAEVEFSTIAQRLAPLYPKFYPKHFSVKLEPFLDRFVGRFRAMLYVVLAAVGTLLLIGCGNVANLLLARATTREKEFAVRAALGASRWTLARQLLIESVLLAGIGAVLGCFLAWASLKMLVSIVPPRAIPPESVIRINAPALAATLGVAAFTALMFGSTPAILVGSQSSTHCLRDTGKSGNSGLRQSRFRNGLVVSGVALSLTLLVGSGLFMKSFIALRQVNLGLKPDHVLVARLPLPQGRYRTADQLAGFYRPLLARLKALPGVVDAAEMSALPPYGGIPSDVEIQGKVHEADWNVLFQLCSEGYFPVLRTQFLAGRSFTEAEVNAGRKLAVINQTFVRKHLGNEDPIGKRVRFMRLEQFPDVPQSTWFEIIGVISDVRNQGMQQPALPEVWLPYTVTASGFHGVFVRTVQDPSSMLNAVQREIWATDSNVGMTQAGTFENSLRESSLAQPRFGFFMVTFFAAIGLILGTAGVYSVITYNTKCRTHEIGIRMALGASGGEVFRLVIRNGARLVVIGIIFGFAFSLGLSRIVASQLWGVSPRDPATLALAPTILLLTGIAACWLPAWGATRVDPAICLRYE
jgi:predicted permease